MKRAILAIFLLLSVVSVQAQRGGRPSGHPQTPQPLVSELRVSSHDNIQFYVFVNGEPTQILPSRQVDISLPYQSDYEIIVVTKTPQLRAATLVYRPETPAGNIDVRLNHRSGNIELVPSNPAPIATSPAPPVAPPPYPGPSICSQEQFEAFASQLRGESFDETRLTVAQIGLRNRLFTCQQLQVLAAIFTFDESRVKFLKAAYTSCADPENYVICVQVLTFSSSREEVLKYIANLR